MYHLSRPYVALRLLTLAIGTFYLSLGVDKLSWLADPSRLTRFFENWLRSATVLNEWYLLNIAIPATPVWARLVPLGELSVGVALLAGFLPRYAAMLAIFMVLNIQFASGALFRPSALTNANILPLLGGLLAVVVGGGRLPLTVTWAQSQHLPESVGSGDASNQRVRSRIT